MKGLILLLGITTALVMMAAMFRRRSRRKKVTERLKIKIEDARSDVSGRTKDFRKRADKVTDDVRSEARRFLERAKG
jgi:Flp pilus assembly protein TadB